MVKNKYLHNYFLHLREKILLFFTFQPLSLSDTDEFCGQLAHIILELEMSDWVGIDLELMWNLLPQSVLRGLSNGEATYYLTLMSSAVNLIKSGPINLMPLVRIF